MTRPRLVAHARLRWDRLESRYILLSPERGLLLNPTAAAIVKLCDGERTVAEIVERLQVEFPDRPGDEIAAEVATFLERIERRGLLEEAA